MKIYKFQIAEQSRFGVLEEPSTIRVMTGSPFSGSTELGDETWPLSSLRILPPTVDHPRVFGVGFNYKSHIHETGRPLPEIPPFFMKPDTSLVGSGADIVYPTGSTVVHYETELVAIIGKKARNVSRTDALDYVLGYACGNDVSERTIQKKEMSMGLMTVGKAFDTFAPIGPCIETDLNPSKLHIQGRLNGSVVQDGTTSDLIFSVAELIEYLSRSITLLPGDVIMTGTPAGVGPLKPGDVFEIEIEGIGTLSNCVIAERT